MKSILLTTTAIVAFAGAAYADGHTGVSFSGDATLGYNDDPIEDEGFYWDLDLDVGMSQELDNGLTAGANFEIDVTDDNLGNDLVAGDYVLSLTTENAGLYVGDTGMAADSIWTSAGDMEQDGFSATDGETVLRGDVTVSNFEASVSYILADNANVKITDIPGSEDDVTQLSVGAAGTFGNFTVGAAYQEEIPAAIVAGGTWTGDDLNVNEIFGIFGSASVSGADITLAYADQADETSTGIKVAYPFGPVTGTVYYVDESNGDPNMGLNVAYSDGPIAVTLDLQDDQGVSKVGLDGSYDVGNGLTILAGMYNQSDDATDANNGTDYYVAGEYDLGGGASLLVAYADAETAGALGDDEVGGPDYQVGTTVEVSFSF